MEEMTLIHHVAFDANVEALEMMKSLPYYKDIVDLDNNEVGLFVYKIIQVGWTPSLWAVARGEM